MIVVDASVLVDILLQAPAAVALERRLSSARWDLHVPYLVDVEVTHAFRRYARLGVITDARGAQALDRLAVLTLLRYPHDKLLPRMWALRNNLTAYEAAYVALAEALDAPLVTRDRRLAASTTHAATIELI